MRRLPIYRRGTDSEVRVSERSPLWQGMGHLLRRHSRNRTAVLIRSAFLSFAEMTSRR